MRFSRRTVAALLATTVTAAVAAAGTGTAVAEAPPSGTRSLGPVATDGERLVIWEAAPGVIRVASERAGEPSADHPAPAFCHDGFSELAAGGGNVALLCWDEARIRSRLALLELATGSWRELPDPDSWRRDLGGGLELVDVGARWLKAGTDAGPVLVDLRDGSRQPVQPPGGEPAALDLDAERPYRPECAASLPHPPIASDPPYLLGAADERWIALWRCGVARPVLLDAYVEAPQLGGAIASWEAVGRDAGARAHLARCRLTLAWPGWSFSGIAHTRRALYTVAAGRLRRAPLPTRCPRPATLRIRAAGARAWTRVPAQLWPTGPGGAPPLAVRPPTATPRATAPVVRQPRGRLELRLAFPATQVVWRIGPRRWTGTMVGSDRRRWRIPGPRRDGATRIAIEARDDRALVAQRYLLTIRR